MQYQSHVPACLLNTLRHGPAFLQTHTSPASALKMFKFKRFAPPIMGYADFKR